MEVATPAEQVLTMVMFHVDPSTERGQQTQKK